MDIMAQSRTQSGTYITIAVSLLVLTAIELIIFIQTGWGFTRNVWLLTLMTTKALMVALFYMNLSREPLSLKIAFFMMIPIEAGVLLFMLYDATYLWRS